MNTLPQRGVGVRRRALLFPLSPILSRGPLSRPTSSSPSLVCKGEGPGQGSAKDPGKLFGARDRTRAYRLSRSLAQSVCLSVSTSLVLSVCLSRLGVTASRNRATDPSVLYGCLPIRGRTNHSSPLSTPEASGRPCVIAFVLCRNLARHPRALASPHGG